MREIKFRAWDNRSKKWLCGYEYPNLGGFNLLGETVLLGEWSGVLDRFLMGRDGYEPEDLIAMQYTGLEDKNGKEIYEGDIVKSEQWNPSTYQICFNRGAFYIAKENRYEVADIKYVEDFEIIGNIYENPDLIK